MHKYEVKSVVSDYGLYEDGKLKLIVNSSSNAMLIKAIMEKDDNCSRNINYNFSEEDYKKHLGSASNKSKESSTSTESCSSQVKEIMRMIRITPNLKGYDYLVAAVTMIVDNYDESIQLTKVVYPSVAEMYNTIPSRVERAIRHAIEVAVKRGDARVLESVLGYSVPSVSLRPTNSEFIASIVDRIIEKKMGVYTSE